MIVLASSCCLNLDRMTVRHKSCQHIPNKTGFHSNYKGNSITIVTISCLYLTEPPKVAEPLSPLHAPGNCRDLTNVTIATARVGLNLCVLASSESRLYLECTPAKGFPAPTTEWFKDGEKINSSSVFVILSNGTLLIQSILHPIESSATGVPGVMGLYTCLLSNVAGAANTSSYIVPFGGKHLICR